MKEETCKICKKKTKYMYGMNDGIYCDKHKEIGIIKNEIIRGIESLKDRCKIYN